MSEIAIVQSQHFDLKQGLLRFYHPKVDKEQLHRLSSHTWHAARWYFEAGDALPGGLMMRASKKNGELGKAGMSIGGLPSASVN